MKFEVKETSKRYEVTGTKVYRILFDNRYDAVKHCNYLNRQEEMMEQFREQNIKYYITLSKIKLLTEQIHRETGELNILEVAIKIKELIRDVM